MQWLIFNTIVCCYNGRVLLYHRLLFSALNELGFWSCRTGALLNFIMKLWNRERGESWSWKLTLSPRSAWARPGCRGTRPRELVSCHPRLARSGPSAWPLLAGPGNHLALPCDTCHSCCSRTSASIMLDFVLLPVFVFSADGVRLSLRPCVPRGRRTLATVSTDTGDALAHGGVAWAAAWCPCQRGSVRFHRWAQTKVGHSLAKWGWNNHVSGNSAIRTAPLSCFTKCSFFSARAMFFVVTDNYK